MKNEESCNFCPLRSRCIFGSFFQLADHEKFIDSLINLNLKKGQILIETGDTIKGVYFLKKGVLKQFHTFISRSPIITKFYTPGEVVALDTTFLSSNYQYNIESVQDSELCYLPIKIFKKYLLDNVEVMHLLMTQIVNEKIEAERKLLVCSAKNVRERVASSVLDIANRFGNDEKGNINIALSREEIAGLSFTTTESAIRYLSELKDEKLIALDNKHIKIIDPKKLNKCASILT